MQKLTENGSTIVLNIKLIKVYVLQEKIFMTRARQKVLKHDTKMHKHKIKINKSDFTDSKIFCSAKVIVREIKRQAKD